MTFTQYALSIFLVDIVSWFVIAGIFVFIFNVEFKLALLGARGLYAAHFLSMASTSIQNTLRQYYIDNKEN